MATSLDEILKLSVPERLQIVQEIWDSIAAEPEQLPLTDWQRAELDRRIDTYRCDPSAGVTWDELKARLHHTE